MKSTEPIKNDELVVAITASGQKLNYRFGNLKQDFQAKRIKEKIKKIYVPRTNKNYFIVLKPTQGCIFKKINSEATIWSDKN